MKKSLSLLLVSALSLTMLAGCGSDDKKEETKAADTDKESTSAASTDTEAGSTDGAGDISGKVVFLTNRTDMVGKQYSDYKKRFEEKYPNVKIEFEAVTDYEKTEKIRIATGEYPDVVLIGSGIPNSDFPKYFEPLDDIQFSGDISFKDLKSYEGHMYGVSSGGSTVGIVYNKKAFEKAGITAVPKTLDEFYAAAQKLKDAGITPLASNFKDKWPLDTWIYDVPTMIGGASDHQNKRADSDTPYTMDGVYGQSWSILRTLYEKGFLEKDINSTNWENSKKDVAQGKFGMYLLGNWVINQVIENGAASEDVGFFPFPTDNSGTLKAPLNPDWFYGVNKNGNVAAAKAFVKWMIEESGFDDFAGLIPTLKDKQSNLAQLAEFNGYNPQYIEAGPSNDVATSIQNAAQIDQGKVVQEFVLAPDQQSILDKYNKLWANAKKSVVK
ncbi:ABC-type glycerol-3-phosphate transport system substrate-binding protein [Paenibacillus cellulosilyticus]|uniref:ABC-type glycerol-3-phosphate transport system substrate-binding protein n=1 Tax=Paenibacillus cellulosilyticus TaxID=375489 RepID=A0A2V2YC89_9BACL|nr:extracellular solute-binding protein [Paenibacillus cellulosilyticus]PWV89424.1 ABC-type glycerol-3-phosphate transport system substrate-binding protein [Paenibacillus cellulosilyticus]QKS47285.1 extracellular solute-binding protein [Paenibacillus cellulosilyticus]